MLGQLVDDTRRKSAHTDRMSPDEECDRVHALWMRRESGQKASEWDRQRRLRRRLLAVAVAATWRRGRGEGCMIEKCNGRIESNVAR